MFRGKSSNRIELSRLAQDLLNFGVLGSLRLWGGGRRVGGHLGAWGVSPHTCTCTRTYAHLYMYRNCKWPPTWRHPCLACLTCMCMHACVHAWDIPPHPHTHPHPHLPIHHPPRGVNPRKESLKIR